MENIERAILLKQELDELRPLDKEQEDRIMQKFRLDWNYHSNNLEGNSLTYGETKALLLHGITAQGKPLKDHFEITGHNEAILWIEDVLRGNEPLTEVFIRSIHKLLLKEDYDAPAKTPDGQPTTRRIAVGRYKTAPNHVETVTGEMFYFATVEETPAKMYDLMQWYREEEEKPDTNGILLAAEYHYRFIRIHPFDDGNGRMARILMNFILMKYGYPPVVIKTQDKKNYLMALRQADAENFFAFVDYIAVNLLRSLDIMLAGARGESIEEDDDIFKEVALLKQRLNSTAKPIEEHRDEKTLGDIFDNSVTKLYSSQLPKFTQFQDYYFAVHQVLIVDGTSMRMSQPYNNSINHGKTYLTHNTSRIILRFHYERFKLEGFGEFTYKSEVVWEFHKEYYTVNYLAGNKHFTLSYGQNLTTEQISELGKAILEDHKQTIEDKLAQIEAKNVGQANSQDQ